MFKKKKPSNPKEENKKNELAGMLGGLGMDPEDMTFGIGVDDDDDDSSLEAELAALQRGHARPRKKKQKQMGLADINNLAAESLRSDDEEDDDDLDDPELLAELQCIAPGEDVITTRDPTPALTPTKVQVSSSSPDISELLEREKMYHLAIDNAQKAGDGSKARRYDRGLKQIQGMIKQAKAGKTVNMDEVPPPVSTGAPPQATPPPPQPEPAQAPVAVTIPQKTQEDKPKAVGSSVGQVDTRPVSAEKDKILEQIKTRQSQYKIAALTCKRAGDIAHAKQFLVVSKQLNSMVQAVSNNQMVDVSQLPPVPTLLTAQSQPVSETRQQSGSPTPHAEPGTSAGGTAQESKSDTGPPPPPKDISEALQQRLEKYNQAANKAKDEENSSKARRMGRIVKQYEDAIKNYKAGRPVDFEELPVPPGFAPITIPGQDAPQQSELTQVQAPAALASPQPQKLQVQIPKPSPQAQPQAQPQAPARKPSGRNEQQLNFLMERQKEFKMAALKAKKQGDMDEAKHWLRMSKGLDPMIENASNGLRVDLSSVPSSPSSSKGPAPTAGCDTVVVKTDECIPNPSSPEELTELFSRLEDTLIKQVEMCIRNSKHYQKLGDLNNARMYEKMARSLQQDFDAVKSAKKHRDPPPKFHYEDKSFTIVNSFPDLSDSEVEITIIRCLNIPLPSGYSPKDMYCYVTFEFPYPNPDEPQSGKSQTVKHTINPEYNEVFKVNIDRKNRALSRIFRRQAVKLEVKYERGFLKGDKALGQSQIKLTSFDSKSEIHECVDLMDTDRGRKAVGGKVEVKLRMREPITDKDVQIEKWKWLVIDMHLGGRKGPELSVESLSAKTSPKPGRTVNQGSMDEIVSLEVLKMEKQLADRQISAQKAKGSMPSTALILRSKQCQQKLEQVQTMLSKGNQDALQNYGHQLAGQISREQTKAQQAVQAGNKTEAQLCLTRKKLMQNELIALKPKLGLK